MKDKEQLNLDLLVLNDVMSELQEKKLGVKGKLYLASLSSYKIVLEYVLSDFEGSFREYTRFINGGKF